MTSEQHSPALSDPGVDNLFETVIRGYHKRQVEDYIAWLQEQVTAVKAELTDAQKKELKVESGVRVTDAQGAAARAGIRRGDVVTAVNNQDVKSIEHFRELMGQVEKGRIVALLVRRSAPVARLAAGGRRGQPLPRHGLPGL